MLACLAYSSVVWIWHASLDMLASCILASYLVFVGSATHSEACLVDLCMNTWEGKREHACA